MAVYEPELGQALFGKAYSEHEAPYYYAPEVTALGQILHDKGTVGANPASNSGESFSNDTFDLRAYYWGECTCGFDDRSWAFTGDNPHAPSCFFTRYHEEKDRLRNQGKGYNTVEKHMVAWGKKHGHPDGLRGVAVYCTCGRDKLWAEWIAINDHTPECPDVLPNFLYKPTGLEVRWYKYAGRGTTTNDPTLTLAQLREVMNACLLSTEADK